MRVDVLGGQVNEGGPAAGEAMHGGQLGGAERDTVAVEDGGGARGVQTQVGRGDPGQPAGRRPPVPRQRRGVPGGEHRGGGGGGGVQEPREAGQRAGVGEMVGVVEDQQGVGGASPVLTAGVSRGGPPAPPGVGGMRGSRRVGRRRARSRRMLRLGGRSTDRVLARCRRGGRRVQGRGQCGGIVQRRGQGQPGDSRSRTGEFGTPLSEGGLPAARRADHQDDRCRTRRDRAVEPGQQRGREQRTAGRLRMRGGRSIGDGTCGVHGASSKLCPRARRTGCPPYTDRAA